MAVAPNMSLADRWDKHYNAILAEILEEGQLKPRYKKSLPRRIMEIITTALCTGTCCVPCVLWDCLCCTMYNCCGCAAKHGLATQFVSKACSDIHEDSRKTELAAIKQAYIPQDVMVKMCNRYMAEFDRCVASHTPTDSRRANMIRAVLVDILRLFSPGFQNSFLIDDGNIANVRAALDRLPTLYATMTNNKIA